MRPGATTSARRAKGGSLADDALRGAARELELILREMHPGHTFVVELRQHDTDDRARSTTRTRRVDEPGAVMNHPDPTLDRDDMPTPARPRDKHRLEQAA